MNTSVRETLQNSKLFELLSEGIIDRLVDVSQPVNLVQNQTLFSKDDPADAVYIITRGQIAIEVFSEHGRSIRVATLQKGEMIGELAVLDKGVRTADARACEESSLLRIDGGQFMRIAENNTTFLIAIIRDLIRRLRTTNSQVENISLRPLRSRLALMLIEFISNDENNTEITITQSELAECLSATREKVNIHLQAIQQAGAITLKRGRIIIKDQEILRSFIDAA